MQNYELLLLFAEDVSEPDQKKQVDAIKETIEKNKGNLKNSESWGKKPLAFQIDQSKSGFYWLLTFSGSAELPKKLTDLLRIEDSVLRFILTLAEETKKVKKPLKEIAPKKKLTETFIR